MATMVTRHRLVEASMERSIDHVSDSAVPGWEVAVDYLIGQLMSAFFVAMGVMWIITIFARILE